jgi:hypothetical protein
MHAVRARRFLAPLFFSAGSFYLVDRFGFLHLLSIRRRPGCFQLLTESMPAGTPRWWADSATVAQTAAGAKASGQPPEPALIQIATMMARITKAAMTIQIRREEDSISPAMSFATAAAKALSDGGT